MHTTRIVRWWPNSWGNHTPSFYNLLFHFMFLSSFRINVTYLMFYGHGFEFTCIYRYTRSIIINITITKYYPDYTSLYINTLVFHSFEYTHIRIRLIRLVFCFFGFLDVEYGQLSDQIQIVCLSPKERYWNLSFIRVYGWWICEFRVLLHFHWLFFNNRSHWWSVTFMFTSLDALIWERERTSNWSENNNNNKKKQPQ